MRLGQLHMMIVTLAMSSISSAAVENFNEMIQRSAREERSLHNKVLEQLSESDVSKSFNESWEQLKDSEKTSAQQISVNLVVSQN